MQQQPVESSIHSALTKLSLIRGSTPSRTLLQDLSDVTGIPFTALLRAERRMGIAGTLAPLRELFANPTLPRAERLRYRLGIKRVCKGPGYERRVDASRLIIDVESELGRLQIAIDMAVRERPADGDGFMQTAHLAIGYRLTRGTVCKTFHQSKTLRAYAPGPRFHGLKTARPDADTSTRAHAA